MRPVAVLLGAGWGALLLAGLWPGRPLPARAHGHRPRQGAPRSQRPGFADRTGRAVLGLVSRTGPIGTRAAATVEPTRFGRSLLAAAATVIASSLPLGAAVGVLVWALPALGIRRSRRRRAAAIRRHLPETVDLLALAVGAGLTVPLAVAAVARRAAGPVGEALGWAVAEAGAGLRFADALAELPRRLGEDARPLAVALVASVRDGSPLGDGLDRLAGELRADRRRRAEESARRVPIKLLFPLVCCILPAFALLTVAPLLAGALQALRP